MKLDVSLLILNAGLLSRGELINTKPGEIQALMDVNMYHPTAMLKKFVPGLLNRSSENRRKKQSGLIVVSSSLATSATPASCTYSASKAYLEYLCFGLEREISVAG